MIHLACVVDDVGAARSACPPEEAIVVTLGSDLACVGRRCSGRGPTGAPADLVQHDQLLGLVMDNCTSVVPFRYGTVLADPVAIEAELSPHRQEFYDLLDRLRGRVELALRARTAPTSGPSPAEGSRPQGPGSSYLRSLGALPEDSPLKRLHRTLAVSATAALVERDGSDGVKASYLVEEVEVDGFKRLLDRTVAEMDDIGPVSLTGPWAPYTFAATIGAVGPDANTGGGGNHG